MKKYFEYKNEKSAKFWEILLNEKTITTRYGKIGTAGQVSEKEFETVEKAEKEYHKLVKEKTEKGYLTIGETNIPTDTKTDNAVSEVLVIPFFVAQQKYNLNFLPSYVVEEHEKANILVFEADAHFDTLDFDIYVFEHNVNIILFCNNLSATNWIIQKEMDYGPTVIVMGNVQAKNLWCSGGNIYFKGNVTVEQSFIAGIYNHGELEVTGDIQAELVISEDHVFSYNTISKGIAVFDQRGSHTDIQNYTRQDALAKKYLEEGEYLATETIFKAIKKGETLLKSAKPNTPFLRQLEKSAKTGFTKLDISNLLLQEIPKEVFDLQDLKELNLGGNSISELPNEIVNLKKLEILGIGSCTFKIFPKVVFELTQLTSINIRRNSIEKIPSKITQLHSLTELNLYDCGVTEFPECIYELENLEDLNISYLQDVEKPIVFSKSFKKLKTLDMSANHHAKIEAVLPQLTELTIRNCSLATIPTTIFQSTKLKKMDVSLNRNISAFTEKLRTLTNLTELSFSTSMSDISEIQHLPKLKKLVVHFDDKPSKNFEDILLNPHWTELGIEGTLEDIKLWKRILSRPNLKKLEEVSSMGNRTIDIEEGRKELKIKM